LHRSTVLIPYTGLIAVSGRPILVDGLPNTATAATWSATAGGNGRPNPKVALGSAVMRSTAAAPCEYPPTTMLVEGQAAAVAWMRALASSAPTGADWRKS
jgi:hypothetical protein